MKNLKHSFNIVAVLGMSSLFAAACLEEHGTINIPDTSSSGTGGKPTSSSSSSTGDGGMLFTSSSSSSGSGNMGGMGGAGVSSSSSSASSSSGLGGSGVCPECTTGTPPTCAPLPRLMDDCSKPGELCNGTGMCECGLSPMIPTACVTAGTWGVGNNGECLQKCDGQAVCQNKTFTCPAGSDCHVECNSQDSCRGATINCPVGYQCSVSCTGQDACNNATINCSSNGPCVLKCDSTSGGNTCKNADLICGDNSCQATCVGASTPILTTNQSCNPKGC